MNDFHLRFLFSVPGRVLPSPSVHIHHALFGALTQAAYALKSADIGAGGAGVFVRVVTWWLFRGHELP